MATLLYGEHDNKTLSEQTAKALTAARQIDPNVDIIICGHNAYEVAKQAASLSHVGRVLYAEADYFAHPLAEPVVETLLTLASDYQNFIASSATSGKNIMPRLAAKLDVAQISDVIEVIDSQTFKRPIYAGNAIATVRALDEKKVLTIRTSAFKKADGGIEAPICDIQAPAEPKLSRFIGQSKTQIDAPDLSNARIIIAGGRGLGSKEEFENLLHPIACKLGAAIGASRAAVDQGFAPNDAQIGQTGKIVSPEIYLAVGISGAIQHMAGIKDSGTIVAINKDGEAPIMQNADYVMTGDLFEILPALEKAL